MSQEQATEAKPLSVPKKVFISYSWTSDEHVEWVLSLATRLVEGDGVDVVIDRWSLAPGQDKYHFMEKMVTDPSIDKVLVICDHKYKEKADNRKGGVGTESTIISHEVYTQVDQVKFLPIIAERNPDGNPYTPVFLTSRVYIDLSDPLTFEENYEELLRNIFEKPLYTKPPLGRPPTFLQDDSKATLSTTYKRRMFQDAVLKNKPHSMGLASDYLDELYAVLISFKLPDDSLKADEPFDEIVFKSIEEFKPYRDDYIDFLIHGIRYSADSRLIDNLHTFFEKALVLLNIGGGSSYQDPLLDNYNFILNELFLYTITVLVKYENFRAADTLLSHPYYDASGGGGGIERNVHSYGCFQQVAMSLEGARQSRLGTQHYSLTGHLIEERATHQDIKLDDVRDVDYALYLRFVLHAISSNSFAWNWQPMTIHSAWRTRTLPLFKRAASKGYFEKLKLLLGVKDLDELKERVENLCQNKKFDGFLGGRWGSACDRNKMLMNFDSLSTM